MKKATKNDQGKPNYALIPPKSMSEVAKVFTYGAQKYGERNWEKGLAYSRLYAAIQRHLWAYWAGEDLDPESGLPHLAHAAASIFMLLEYQRTHPELDDRADGTTL